MGIRSFLAKKKKSKSSSNPSSPNNNESPIQSPTSATKPEEEIEEIFRKFDVNGDGKIEWSELGLIMTSLGNKVSEEELKRMVKEVDSDGDGFIDLKEFIELNNIDSDKHLDDVKSAFSILDANGDGSISPHELQRVLRSIGDNASIEDCKKMINAVDRDGDGFVSFEEFKIMMINGGSASDFFSEKECRSMK